MKFRSLPHPYNIDIYKLSIRLNVGGIAYFFAIIAGLTVGVLTKDCHSNYLSSSIYKLVISGASLFFLGLITPIFTTALIFTFGIFSDNILKILKSLPRNKSPIRRFFLCVIRMRMKVNNGDNTHILNGIISFLIFVGATINLLSVSKQVFSWEKVIEIHQIAKVNCDPLEGKMLPPNGHLPYEAPSDWSSPTL